MIKTGNPKVKYLIDATIKKSSSDISSALADLGGGHMSQGLYNLWKNGELIGIAEGVAGTTAAVSVLVLVYAAIYKWRMKQTLTTLVDESDAIRNVHPSTTDADNTVVQQSADGEPEITE